MLYGLIAVRVLPHVHDLHFTNLMNGKSIIAVIKKWRHHEHRVEHLHELFIAPHQIDQSSWVVEYRPGIVPTVPFGKGVSPFSGTKRRLE